MESTAPEYYQKIAHRLPPVTAEKNELIENISRICLKWAEQFRQEYPLLSSQGRPVRASEEDARDTSFQTYTKGELATFSENTLKLYYLYVNQLLAENKNLTQMVMENTVREYGYKSLDEAERRIGR